MDYTIKALGAIVCLYIITRIYTTLIRTPLRPIPGPRLFALTKWRLAYEDYRGTRTTFMQVLHEKYGDAVRVGPNEVSFNSLSALRAIYGAGTVFQRSSFYRMFDAYGRQNMFSVSSGKDHRGLSSLLILNGKLMRQTARSCSTTHTPNPPSSPLAMPQWWMKRQHSSWT